MRPLEGRVGLVTGGASGIGRATVERLVAEGVQVAALDRDEGALAMLADTVPVAVTIAADVRDSQQIDAAVDRVEYEAGPLDLVVASAGIADDDPVIQGDPTQWRDVLDVNARGVMITLGSAATRMVPRDRGDLVAVASVSSRITYTGQPAYVASKHAVWAFTDVLRQELAATRLRVVTVQPGLVDTPLSRPAAVVADLLSNVDALHPGDCADAIIYAISREPSVAVNEVVLRPTGQIL